MWRDTGFVDSVRSTSSAMDAAALAAWLDERCGCLTGSRMAAVMGNKKDGSGPLKKRADLLRDLLAERVTGANTRHYVTQEMQWGLDHEPEARVAYMAETSRISKPSRYYAHPTIENLGATPDGEEDAYTLTEFKCPTTGKFLEYVMDGVVPEEYKPQMITQLLVTGRNVVNFVAFDPRIRDPKRRLFIRLFEPTPSECDAVQAAAIAFLEELDAMFDRFVTGDDGLERALKQSVEQTT